MTMTGLINSKLKDPAKTDLRAEVGFRVYQRGSLGIGDVPAQPDFPYVMHGMGESLAVSDIRETASVDVTTENIYVYDKPGSYVRIKRIHRLIKQDLIELVGARDTDGTFCFDFTYEGRGGELYDQVQNQALIVATYRVVATD